MVRVKINGENIIVEENTTILEACKRAGYKIPTLCYLKDINEIGACKICSVEVKGIDRLVTSCNNKVNEGMEIFTNTKKVREARKINLSLILSKHKFECATCIRSNDCLLEKIAYENGVREIPYKVKYKKEEWNQKFPLIRNLEKCIGCMRCMQICSKIQGLNIWDLIGTGSRATVGVKENKKIEEVDCSLCGQCIVKCPVGALHVRDDVEEFLDALEEKESITVVQIAPAVRTAIDEAFNKRINIKNIVYALRKMGVDYVFDTTFAADMTIMEEGSELIEIIKGKRKGPLFTSCCPAWMRFVKSNFKSFIPFVSSVKSPQQIFGSLIKTYFKEKNNIDKKIVSVSIMPCVAKKAEKEEDILNEEKTVDIVLTTRELVRILKQSQIAEEELKESEFDTFGTTGSGVIFGTTKGVTESALRTVNYILTGKKIDLDVLRNMKNKKFWKEIELEIKDKKISIAVVSGLSNTRKLLSELEKGRVQYDFIEVMACPGGCVNGGGQVRSEIERNVKRKEILYDIDNRSQIRNSFENIEVIKCYKEFLGEPLSKKAHQLLHRGEN